jgi:phospholipid/cholesterol/gamma-HCH transport system substrate-binding protein
MRGISTELKVGLFAIVVIAVLSYMTFKVGGIDLMKREGYIVNIYFKNVAGLDEKTKVKIAGVNAGIIEKIELKEGRAKLTVRLNKEITLYHDASASIKAAGLLGDKYLEIKTGKSMPVLSNGDTLENVVEIVDLDDLARNLTAVSENINILAESLNATFSTEESKTAMKDSIINLKDITGSLKESITVNDQKMRTTLDNVNSLAKSINELIEKNSETVTTAAGNMREFSQTLKREGPQLVENLNKAAMELRAMVEENRPTIKSAADSIDQIAKKVEKGEGTLGKLIKDESLYDSVQKAAAGIEKTVSAVDRFRAFLTFQAEYLTEPADSKGYFYLTLQPKPDKYYILGVVSDPVAKVKNKKVVKDTPSGTIVTNTDTIEKEVEFTAQFAKRFDDLALRIGLTENTFGVGADYFFLNDKAKITADAWDFSNDEEGSKSPHVKVGVDYFVFKNLFVSAGADNVLNSKWRGAYAGAGFRFEDEDIKYLFGTLPSISTK